MNHFPNTNSSWFVKRKSMLHTFAINSPRFGPLISQSLMVSSTLYRIMNDWFWSSLLGPQRKDVLILTSVEMGCPAYKEGVPLLLTLPNGVAKMLMRAAATIYNGTIIIRRTNKRKAIWKENSTHMHLWYVDRYSDLSPSPFSTIKNLRVLMACQILERYIALIQQTKEKWLTSFIVNSFPPKSESESCGISGITSSPVTPYSSTQEASFPSAWMRWFIKDT